MLHFQKVQLKQPPMASLKPAQSSNVFLQLQTLTADSHEILLDNSSPLSKIVKVWDPVCQSYIPSLVKYDSGGGLCYIQDGEHLNLLSAVQKTETIELACVNGKSEVSYDVIIVDIKTPDSSIQMELCLSDFPWEKPSNVLKQIKFKGFKTGKCPDDSALEEMPKLLLGIRAAKLLPVPLTEDQVPREFREKFPGLDVFQSKLTGKLMFAGMLERAGLDNSTSMLTFTASAKRDKETTSGLLAPGEAVWPPLVDPLSQLDTTQGFLLSYITWFHNLQEIRDAICAPSQSVMAGQLKTAGCLMCCPLAKELAEIHRNNVLLDAQILFEPSKTLRGGRFVLTRMHNHLVDSLPSGEAQSKGCTRSLIKRLEKQPYTAALMR